MAVKPIKRAGMADQITTYIAEIRALFESKMWIKGRDLKTQLRKAGRRLPKKIRRDVALLIDLEKTAANPKLSRMIDMEKATQAHANIVAFMEKRDPRAALLDRIIGIAASIAFALIVVTVLLLYVLVQRGFI